MEPHKGVFIGRLADSDQWEIGLQVVRALPLFEWMPRERERLVAILERDTGHPQKFVRAWALDSLATFAHRDHKLVARIYLHLNTFEQSG